MSKRRPASRNDNPELRSFKETDPTIADTIEHARYPALARSSSASMSD